MIKTYLLILAGFILFAYSKAQVAFQTGEKLEGFNDSYRFYKLHENVFYTNYLKGADHYIDVFDRSTLSRVHHTKIPLPTADSIDFDIENIFIQEDTFRVFYSYFNRSTSSVNLEMTIFDLNGIKCGETKLIDKSEGKNKRKAGGFGIYNRQSRNEFLSYGYRFIKDTTLINIDYFDYEGIKNRSQNIVLPDERGVTVHYMMDEDCDLYLLTRNKRGKRNASWSMKIYTPDISEPKIIPLHKLDSSDIILTEFYNTYYDPDGNICLLTPYSEGTMNEVAKGVYIVKINQASNTLVKESIVPFKRKNEEKNEETNISLSSCIIKKVLTFDDNRSSIIIESRLKTTTTMYGVPVANQYEIGNIITMDLDSNDSITEIHKIKKDQYATPDYYRYTGFAILADSRQSFFIYNDLAENLQKTPDKMKKVKPGNIDETVVIQTTIENNKVKRSQLIDKLPDAGIDAVLPNSYLSDIKKGEIYLVRKVNSEYFPIKIYIKQ